MPGWHASTQRSSLSFGLSVKVFALLSRHQVSHSTIAGEGKLGSFAKLPYVPPTDELLQSALKRSLRLSRNNKLKTETLKARNLTARQLDTLTKELAVPLGKLIKGFPAVSQLHQFEQALLLLTLGPQRYERHLNGVDSLRKSLLEVGKGYAAQAAKAKNKADAVAIQEAGFANMQSVYAKGETSLINLKEVAKQLRRLPTVEVDVPMVALVGAPNVGKSSLVRALSSGLPEVCDYPFTTRSVKMGHFFIGGVRHQVTDTPGLLLRPDEERNAMEALTLACLEHLPTAVLFVMDLTGGCGMSVPHQWAVRQGLRRRFPAKPWLDVLSKADLLGSVFATVDSSGERSSLEGSSGQHADAQTQSVEIDDGGADFRARGSLGNGSLDHAAAGGVSGEGCESRSARSSVMDAVAVAAALPDARRVSSVTEAGLQGLMDAVVRMLSSQQTQLAHEGLLDNEQGVKT